MTVARIVSLTGAEPGDATRLAHLVTDVAALDLAGPADLAFIESGKYAGSTASRPFDPLTIKTLYGTTQEYPPRA